MIKTYYQCVFRQESPLSITSGNGNEADLDVLLDARGFPYIPGTALAGLLRDMAGQDPAAVSLFGEVKEAMETGEASAAESRLIVSDALLPTDAAQEDIHVSIRDSVAINDEGAADDQGKFDFQIVETALPYTAVLELTHGTEEDAEYALLRRLAERIAADGITCGHKTTRGYGKLSCTVLKKRFFLGKDGPEDDRTDEWLDFRPWEKNAFDGADPVTGSAGAADTRTILAGIEMRGSFLVQVSSSDIGNADAAPLMSTMAGTADGPRPVIPGTSWAGVFRHRMRELCGQYPSLGVTCTEVDRLFGRGEDGKPAARSPIRFSETAVCGGKELTVTRVALDRFTMAPHAGALFTTKAWQGGSAELRITIPKDLSGGLYQLLEAALLDLHNGLLTLGHSASIGYGEARITELKIDGEPCTELLGCPLSEVSPDEN